MSMFGIFGQPPSDEQIAAIREQQQKNEISNEEYRHSSQRLFEELDKDQLRTFVRILHDLSHDPHMAAVWEGIALMALKSRFNICITCGVNHDEEFSLGEPDPNPEPDPEPRVKESHGDLYFDYGDMIAAGDLTQADLDNMETYHLDDVRIEGTNELIGFDCTGIVGMKERCGTRYPTIEDRMLRGPEHCSGCFIRMGHG